ncbi:MAG: histidine kinase [Ignavibacteriae bacterium HGW-Ignavibacteriae-3]|nr:MAG: histidine kinase [Ignavibacteriae bacterium HGW-Ignavibacteriae-3]
MNNDPNSINPPRTFFDSPERSSREEILKEILHFKENSVINQLLEGYPEPVFIINKNRQILAFNSKARDKFKTDEYFEIIGNRFGEAINCIHHTETSDGCGTSLFCRECGAAKAFKIAREDDISTQEECRITSIIGDKEISHNYFVYSRPLKIEDSKYTMVALRDISSEKWREVLEKIFFHDVLNIAGAVKGLSEILKFAASDEERIELTEALNSSSIQLINEIQGQRELRNAEDGHLQPDFKNHSINEILLLTQNTYKNHELAEGKFLEIKKLNVDFSFVTDSTLLIRCLGNLIKNALEASGLGESITLTAQHMKNEIEFSVHSQKFIPENIQRQLFQRSFSTKNSKGRGIGLYSVKLIAEQYLKGKVSFVSNELEKTVFNITVPANTDF